MTAEEIFHILQQKFGDAIVGSKLDVMQPWIQVAPRATKDICAFLCDDPSLNFDSLMCLSGVDYNNGTFGVVYHLASTVLKHKIVLKVIVPKDDLHVQSVSAERRTGTSAKRLICLELFLMSIQTYDAFSCRMIGKGIRCEKIIKFKNFTME